MMQFDRIYVRPRSHVERNRTDVPYAVVSVHDYDEQKPANLYRNRTLRAALWLCFQDFDLVDKPREREMRWKNGVLMRDMAMQPHHGLSLWRFLRAVAPDVRTLVIHCNAAASRSPSMAMAVADVLGMKREQIDWYRSDGVRHDPAGPVTNKHVYETVIAAAKGLLPAERGAS